MKEKKFTVKTAEGCKSLLILFFCVILIASLCARVVTTCNGALKVEELDIDCRGATLNCEIYYPAGTCDDDSLPAVVVSHGGSIQGAAYKQFAQELARRGFVALLVNAYGNGLSEEPRHEETGQGEGGFNSMATPLGLLDACNYLKTLKFVDPTRIGCTGHSMGALRSSSAALNDCYYLSYNDILVNILYDNFGKEIAEADITKDAFELASELLSEDQFVFFTHLAEEAKLDYDTRIKAICLTGMSTSSVLAPQTVTVAGYEVTRTCKVNLGITCGTFESGRVTFPGGDAAKAGFMQPDGIITEDYYAVDDLTMTSKDVGTVLSGTKSEELKEAAANRSLRLFATPKGTHSKQYFSIDAVAHVCDYFETALGFDSGMSPKNQIWFYRSCFNGIAMLAMLAMIFPFICLLTKSKFFASIIYPATPADKKPKLDKGLFIGTTVFCTLAAMFGVKWGHEQFSKFFGINFLKDTAVWKIQGGANATRIFVLIVALASLISLILYCIFNKKKAGENGLASLNMKMNIGNILKSLLAALLFFCFVYVILLIIEYLFHEDYRFWQTIFTEERPERWILTLPYFIWFFPMYLVIGAAINYSKRANMPEWKDTLLTVLLNSVGVWIACIITYFSIRTSSWTGAFPFNFMLLYTLNLFVPVTVYISRKLYNLPGQIWVDAFVNTTLVCWSLMSSMGPVYYTAQNWLSNLFAL